MATTGFNHTVGASYKSDAGTISSTVQTFAGNSQEDIDVSIAPGVTNHLVSLDITQANIVSMCMFGGGALTLKTNSTGAPQETIVLTAGGAVEWDTSSSHPCPFAGNVTALYVSNANATATRFRLAVLLNS